MSYVCCAQTELTYDFILGKNTFGKAYIKAISSLHVCSVSQIWPLPEEEPSQPCSRASNYLPLPQQLDIFCISLTEFVPGRCSLSAVLYFIHLLPLRQLSLTHNKLPFCCSHWVSIFCHGSLAHLEYSPVLEDLLEAAERKGQEVSFNQNLFLLTVLITACLVFPKQSSCEDYSGGFLNSMVLFYQFTAGWISEDTSSALLSWHPKLAVFCVSTHGHEQT